MFTNPIHPEPKPNTGKTGLRPSAILRFSELERRFSTGEACREYLFDLRWPGRIQLSSLSHSAPFEALLAYNPERSSGVHRSASSHARSSREAVSIITSEYSFSCCYFSGIGLPPRRVFLCCALIRGSRYSVPII